MPPPIQGLGASTGFQMQVELTDGSYDFERLQKVTDRIVQGGQRVARVREAFTAFRASVPQVTVNVDKTHAANLDVNLGDVYNTVQIYLGSTFVNLFTRFGHNYMVYLQADPLRRLSATTSRTSTSATGRRNGPDRRRRRHPSRGGDVGDLPLQPLSRGDDQRHAGAGLQLGPGAVGDGGDRPKTLPRGMAFEWTAMSYQERLVGSSAYFIFALSILLVYFVLAGQYESWITPAAVILAVPMALLGTVSALRAAGFDNNIYVQIGLVLLIALSAKNAILIVEMAREGRAAGKSLPEATVDASRVRFRPILMTSFTFILGVLPLVLATGAGAAARRSLGLASRRGCWPRPASPCSSSRRSSSCCSGGSRGRDRPKHPWQRRRSRRSRSHDGAPSPQPSPAGRGYCPAIPSVHPLPPGGGRGQGWGAGLLLAKFFIERPVLANVIAFVTMLMGAVAIGVLPVAQYPPITPPTVQVSATYPGANARTLVETVALPIEQQVNGVEKMLYMQSTCTSDGRYTLIVTFESAPTSTSPRCWCRTASPPPWPSCRTRCSSRAS